ncbi:MAG: metallophosphoesterase [Candidatus Bathyarchaeia archaeon]
MRIFFATDIHGSEICFKKFLNAPKYYKVDVLILGGDITGKFVVPIVRRGDAFRCRFMGDEWVLRSEEELKSLEQQIRDTGGYFFHVDEEGKRKLDANPEKLREMLDQLILQRVKEWVKMAEERLKGLNVKFFVTGGNDDSYSVDKVLRSSQAIIDPDGEAVSLNGDVEMISLSQVNMTPWKCPRDVPDEDLGERINELASTVRDVRKTIFNLHAPPYGSGLDVAPKLDTSVTPPKVVTTQAGEVVLENVGSRSVRNAIERYQPMLGLHGHVHESRGVAKIGKTICLNPGSEYSEGLLRGVIVTLDKGKVKSYQFTSG